MSGERKHTKGPWSVGGILQDTGDIQIVDPTGRLVIGYATNAASFGELLTGAMRRGTFSSDDAGTQQANARLFAAAPTLAGALQELADAVDEEQTSDADMPSHTDTVYRLERAVEAARAALLKARSL